MRKMRNEEEIFIVNMTVEIIMMSQNEQNLDYKLI